MPKLKPEVLDELAKHGLRPKADTSPALLREQINDLYRFEIRRLRDRCRAGEFTTRELPARVIELRKRYLLLSIPAERWLALPSPPTSAEATAGKQAPKS